MRHKKSGRKLGRTWEHRKAMFRNMARSLISHERIRTTEAKAKELRRVVEKLVTLALRDDLHSRRQAYKVLGNHQLVKKLFDEIGPRFQGVNGGYTRVVKLGLPRPGDSAPLAMIEFTRMPGQAETETKKKPAKAKKPAAPVKTEKKKTETKTKAEPEAEKPKAKKTTTKKAEKPKAEAKKKTAQKAEEPKAEKPEKPKKNRAKKKNPKNRISGATYMQKRRVIDLPFFCPYL